MSVRALTAALIVVLSSSLRAEPAERKPWHATVSPSRPGLPAVTVDFGYPGPYVPMLNAPIVLRATASDVPFDGYIGYHFAVHDLSTLDTPVIARARLRPHESWSFTTFATLRKCCIQNIRIPREVAIEWRTSAKRLIASQSAGAPPWTSFDQDLLPLLITDSLDASNVIGMKPYIERAAALPDRAQWYAGFSSVVCSVATWLDLPQRVREAIFGSGTPLVFFGFPRPEQKSGRLDQTLLPVAFEARSGSYDAPWPYRGSRKLPAAAPLSWTAKTGADKIGADQNPYIVRTNAATWGADDVMLAHSLPSIVRVAPRTRHYMSLADVALERRDRGIALSIYSSVVASVAAILIAITAWLLLRKTPRAAIVAMIVLTTAAVFAQRSRIRPSADIRDYSIRAPIAAGIVDHFHIWRTYGSVPLPPAPPAARTSITGDYGQPEGAELRTSDTAPSMGELHRNSYWDAVSRWTYQRELDTTSANPKRTALPSIYDYHSPIVISLTDQRGNQAYSEIGTKLMSLPDGRMTCTFALPPKVEDAILRIPFQANEALLTWANGSTKLPLTKKDIYSFPVGKIPPDVLRQIATNGGIVNMTFDRPFEREFGRVWMELRESKS